MTNHNHNHKNTRARCAFPARPKQSGVATVLALAFLAIFVSVGFAFMNLNTLSLRQSENFQSIQDARFVAESGLEFMVYHLRGIRLPADTTEATFAANLTTVLGAKLNGTANLAGQTVHVADGAVCVPQVQATGSGAFCAWVRWTGPEMARLTVHGTAHGASRYLTLDLKIVSKVSSVFEYGLASRGQIAIGGSSRIVGVNYPQEANVFSASTSSPDAIHIQGSSVEVSGDLFLSGSSDYVMIQGSPSIGGTTDLTKMLEHIHAGLEPPDFPALNVAPLAALATNVVDSSTKTNTSNAVYNNIRIAAGTNPTFNADVVLNGVVYVEAPNKVKFAGHAQVNAIIVTQDSDQALSNCQLTFAGTVDAASVATLPNTPEFAAVRSKTGTFIVAPGFGVNFQGDFNTISGSIAADQVAFSGNSGGTIMGTVMGLEDLPMTLDGHVHILVDRSHMNDDPAGFRKPLGLEPQPPSYMELVVMPR